MMKLRAIHRILSILILILFSSSCASDLDYNQVNDIKLEPVFISNLAYFDVPANEFVAGGMEQAVIMDASDFDLFRDTFFRENLKRVDLFFEFNNTINRAYIINIVLLNANDLPLDIMTFRVPAYTGGNNVIIPPTEIFVNNRLSLLKNTTKMNFSITMSSLGPPLNENSTGSLKLRSSATAYFVVE